MKTKILTLVELAISAVLLSIGFVGYFVFRTKAKEKDENKSLKKKARIFIFIAFASAWFLVGTLINMISRAGAGLKVEFEMFSERVNIFGISFAKTSVQMWIITLIILLLCLIFRFLIFPKFDLDKPKGFQNVIELAVEATENFTKGVVGDHYKVLAPYMFSLAVFMIFSALAELLGIRPATSDLIVTLSMGLITFFLINYYGIKKKGVAGRLKSLANPTPVVFPFKLIGDIAVPISLACRLFGNMVGGMIVMHLLKSVLGGYAVGLPAVAGLYFNLFHPVIQAYIFVILSLTFINEAIE